MKYPKTQRPKYPNTNDGVTATWVFGSLSTWVFDYSPRNTKTGGKRLRSLLAFDGR
jgi:hypothetical protein